MTEQIKPLPVQIKDSLLNWAAALEAGQKLAIILLPILITVGTTLYTGLIAAKRDPAPVKASGSANIFLHEQLAHLRGPLPNALALWRYPPNYRTREFVSVASPYLSEQVFKEIDGAKMSINGWREQLQSHQAHQIHIINKGDYKPGHPIRDAMNRGGVVVIVSAPVFKNYWTLIGYVSLGYAEPLTPEELELVEVQLTNIAVLAQYHIGGAS